MVHTQKSRAVTRRARAVAVVVAGVAVLACAAVPGACSAAPAAPAPSPAAARSVIPEPAPAARGVVFVSVSRSKQGTLLSVRGTAAGPLYLACAQYPQTFKNAVLEGSSIVLPVQGSFEHTWLVDPQFAGGSYEVSLWSRRVDRDQCHVKDDPWCDRQGFHLEELVTSVSGGLEASLPSLPGASAWPVGLTPWVQSR